MSECVVRMEMPKNCCECQLRKEDYDTGEEFCPFTGVECLSIGRQDNCPIVCALPENHGRLVDADANIETMKKCAENPESEQALLCYRYAQRILEEAPTVPSASPWHRVEEPPKEHGKYPVCWIENGNFHWQEAHYCYYQDGDKWVAWSSYQGDDVEITPDYWMPVEPPKED